MEARNIMLRIGREFVRHVLPGIIKPLHALWNEVIGFIFLSLAALPVPRVIKQVHQYSQTGEGLSRIVLSLCFIAVMAFFGVQSFLRARKISKS